MLLSTGMSNLVVAEGGKGVSANLCDDVELDAIGIKVCDMLQQIESSHKQLASASKTAAGECFKDLDEVKTAQLDMNNQPTTVASALPTIVNNQPLPTTIASALQTTIDTTADKSLSYPPTEIDEETQISSMGFFDDTNMIMDAMALPVPISTNNSYDSFCELVMDRQ